MKDEIKEILEDVKRHLDYVEVTKQASIRDNEMKVMYDYITNLQKENERLKEENKHIFANVNDDQLLRSNAMNYAELQDYKTKNEKAIEKLYCYGEIFDGKILQQFQKEMLEVLQGSDE